MRPPQIANIATRQQLQQRRIVCRSRFYKVFRRHAGDSSNPIFPAAHHSLLLPRCSDNNNHTCISSKTAKRFVSRHNNDDRPESSGKTTQTQNQNHRGVRPLYIQQSRHRSIPPAYQQQQHKEKTNNKHRRQQHELSTLSLTPYEFLGTASVLPPHARHLSPCLGAALAMSPLAGNLMRLGQNQPHDYCYEAIVNNAPLPTSSNKQEQQQPDDGESRNSSNDQNWSKLLSRIGFLANNLFFQLIRESPIHMVRNKSMPAAYLTPGIIGCLLAHHHHHQQQSSSSSSSSLLFQKVSPTPSKSNHRGKRNRGTSGSNQTKDNDSNAILKDALRRDFGIKSNRICDNEWTGISLARWMDLVIPSYHGGGGSCSERLSGGDNNNNTIHSSVAKTEVCHQQSVVAALWLIALWAMTPSKESLLDYYEAIERAGIACDDSELHPGLLGRESNDSIDGDCFTENNFAPKELEAAMNRLLEYYSSSSDDKTIDDDATATARALELVCAAIVLQQQQKGGVSSLFLPPPVVPNGYFAFDGGDTKADCAEVVVREILTLLLWDDEQGIMDVSRLPSTTSRELQAFLNHLNREKGGIRIAASTPENVEDDLGQAWFDLLSDLPHCDYLAKSPNGRAFELAPTSESISAALWHLLVGGCKNENENENENQTPVCGRPWTSLHDLARFWSEEQPQHRTKQPLFVKDDRLKHQSGDGRIMEHELISLHLVDNSKAIELRLRCDFQKASGMAAVTHLTKPKQERLIDPKQVQKLQEVCLKYYRHHHHDEEQNKEQGRETMHRERSDPSLMMLCLALQSEHENCLLPRPEYGSGGDDSSSIALESMSWLATPYGPDRRELKVIDSGDGDSGDSSDYDRKMLAHSRLLLKEQILRACRVCKTHPISGAHLLSWILQESPVVVETSASSLLGKGQDDDDLDRPKREAAIEQALLSLPTSVLDNDSILEAIEWNWMCFRRGRLLTRAIRWKLGQLSAWQVVSQSKFYELAELMSLLYSIERID